MVETIVIIAVISFLSFMVGRYIYRKIKGLPISDCGECSSKGKNLVKAYNKKYQKNCNCKKN